MATLKLKKKPAPAVKQGARDDAPRRPPLRGGAPRKRPTLAEANAEREERARRDAARPPRPARPDRNDRNERTERPVRPPRDARSDDRRGAPPARKSAAPGPRTDRPPRPDRAADDSRPRRDTRSTAPRRDEGAPPPRRDSRTGAPRRDDRAPAPRDTRPTGPRREAGSAPMKRAPLRPATPVVASEPVAKPLPRNALPHEEGERLSKRMTTLGLASRREADEWIEAGWVKVDGRRAVLGQRVRPDVRIEIDPAAKHQQAERVTILLHKPVGYVSGQPEDGYEAAVTLIRPETQWSGEHGEGGSGKKLHPGHLRSLAPAGRLDIDSTGLLVLTQDGRIARQLIGDDSKIEKEYLVRVRYTREGTLPAPDLALLNFGLALDDVPLKPAKVSWANEDQLRFVLREGKKRQIRRMCEAVGLEVLGLKRVRIGSVVLGRLPAGQWRFLGPHERFA